MSAGGPFLGVRIRCRVVRDCDKEVAFIWEGTRSIFLYATGDHEKEWNKFVFFIFRCVFGSGRYVCEHWYF